MKISEIMTRAVIRATPGTTIREAAEKMRSYGIGTLPILEGRRRLGIVTDRDIVIRLLADHGPVAKMPVIEAMSPKPACCFPDQDVAEAAALMGDLQIMRLLVVDRNDDLVGILSVGDIAENASEELAGQALGEISEKRRSALPPIASRVSAQR
ncbi:CBS domain-containing protein [Roseovarius sp. E0-M6]|uniref:CBS domain-containing protein n=1 Tax=Roseovarius sp. E0-M6 TaxID=3127118 RepID=UPI00300FA8EF